MVLREAAKPLLDCLFVAFPLTIILGLGAAIFLGVRAPRKLWFLLVFAGLPCAGVIFFSPTATARGYIAGGAATILFASLGAGLSAVLVRYRRCAGAIAALVILLQLAWSVSYLFGYYFPLSAFCWGYVRDPNPLVVLVVRNLTDAFPLWRFYGGTADFIGAGGLPLGSLATPGAPLVQFWYAVLLNGFFFLAILLLVKITFFPAADPTGGKSGTMIRKRRWGIWLIVWGTSCLFFSALSKAFPAGGLSLYVPHAVTHYPGRQEISRRIDITGATVASLQAALARNPGAEIQVVLMGGPFVQSRFQIGSKTIPATLVQFYAAQTLWRLDRSALIESLGQGPAVLSLEAVLQDGMLGGWQRGDVPGQHVQPATLVQGMPYLPGLELRLYDPAHSSMLWIGY